MLGETLGGRFLLEEELGRGGMGVVYRARDQASGGVCAVKMLENPSNTRRFLREAKVLSRLAHPAIVRYVAEGLGPRGTLFLAMEWVSGGDLGERLKSGPLSTPDALRLCSRLAEGLSMVHAAGIVHRDIKPPNVLLPRGDIHAAKLGDFGIAHLATEALLSATRTATGELIGTPAYFAPEQLDGARVDLRADLFGLGCVLFECLVGKPAFHAESMHATFLKIAVEPNPRVSELRSDVPASVDELVALLLAKQPNERPRTASEVVARIEQLLGDEGLSEVAPASQVLRTLGAAERRLVPVIACRAESGEGAARESDQALREAVKQLQHGSFAKVSLSADGVLLAVLEGNEGPAQERALQAARLARTLLRWVQPRPVLVFLTRLMRTPGAGNDVLLAEAGALLRDAPSGHVVIDDNAAALLESRHEVKRVQGRYVLGGEQMLITRRPLMGRAAPFVGRRKELSLLVSTLEDAIEEKSPQAIVVRGAAGAGKSRLLAELLSAVRDDFETPVRVITARGDPALLGVPHALLAGAIRRGAGISPGQSPERQLAQLRSFAGADQSEPTWLPLLAELCGLDAAQLDPRLRAARREPPAMNALLREGFVHWLVELAQRSAVLLVLDDAHWADVGSMELVSAALGAHGSPLCAVVLARPDVDPEALSPLYRSQVTELKLGGLSRGAAEQMVRSVLPDADATLLQNIVDRADGNAFFLEELIRAAALGDEGPLPDSVLGVMESQLDELETGARRVLRAASVLGQVCWRGGLRAVLGQAGGADDLEGWIATLIAREVLVASSASRFHGETEYAFRHALLRDASYATFEPNDLRAAHARAANWLADKDEVPAVVGHHWQLAEERVRAAEAFMRAAQLALRHSDLNAVIRFTDRAMDAGVEPAARAELELLRSEAFTWMGRPRQALSAASSATRLAPERSAEWHSAAAAALESAAMVGEPDAVVELLERLRGEMPEGTDWEQRASALARASFALILLGHVNESYALLALVDDLERQGHVHDGMTHGHVANARATHAMLERNREVAARHYERAALAFETAGALRLASGARTNLAAAYIELGAPARALTELDQAIGVAERSGAMYSLSLAKLNRGIAESRLGQASAQETLRSALRELEVQGDRRLCSSAAAALSEALLQDAARDEALEAARRAVSFGAGLPATHASALTALAQVHLQRGEIAEALAAAQRADHERVTTAMEEREALLELTLSELDAALGRPDDARQRLERLVASLRSQAAAIESTQLRESFLQSLPEHRRALQLHDTWNP